jgi:secretion/DNA translocation related TadE-like protein
VLVAAAMGVLVLALSGALLVVSVVHDVHRARAGADLAALAAARELAVGGVASCAEGGDVAGANGVTLSSCRLLPDGSVEVGATVPLRVSAPWAGLPSHASASARAGVVIPGVHPGQLTQTRPG